MTQPERDIAEMVVEFAAEFIVLGESVEEQENRLAAACSAWNIACETAEIRPMLLDAWIKAIEESDTEQPQEYLADLRTDMEALIHLKLELFPDARYDIRHASLTALDGKTRIEIDADPMD